MKPYSYLPLAFFYFAVLVLLSSTTIQKLQRESNQETLAITVGTNADVETYNSNRQVSLDSGFKKELDDGKAVVQNTTPKYSSLIYPYPNPATDFIYIKLNAPNDGLYETRIIDVLGRLVLVRYIAPTEEAYTVEVPIGDLEEGMYFISIRHNDGTRQTGKFVKN